MPNWLSSALQYMLDFSNILNTSITASWLILVVIGLRMFLKRAPKWINVALRGIVAVRLLMPFSIESMFSLIPSAETVSDQLLQSGPVSGSGPAYLEIVTNPNFGSMVTVELDQNISSFQVDLIFLTIPWLIGMALMTIYFIASYWSLRRKVSEAVPLRDNIYQSVYADSPFVLGIFRPGIYLPYKMSDRDMSHVIAHEQTHIRRKDHWWKPLGFLLLTVHWFNPLMWLAYVLLCRDIELACDEKVIKELGNEQRADYTQALLTASISRRRIAACPLAFGEVGVKERVKNVMNYKKPAFWIVLVAVLLCVIFAVCFLTDPYSAEICYNGLVYTQQGDPISVLPDGSTEIGTLKGILHHTGDHPDTDYYGTNLQEKYSGCPLYQSGASPNQIFLYDYSGIYIPFVSERYVMLAIIHEIHESTFLVQPLPDSWELNSADMIYVPMENMEPSPEPGVGDIIRVEYDGMLMETYPAQISKAYHISVISKLSQSVRRLINLDGIIYVDTGEAIPAEIDPSAILGTLHTQVEGRPVNHGQGNFDCEGCRYAQIEGDYAVLIDNEWYRFTEEVLTSPEYYLTIGEEGAVSIEIRTGSRVQVISKEDLSAYERGETVLLPVLTGKENLRGVTITVRDADNYDIFSVSISAREHGAADGVIECGEWIITPKS